MTALKRPAFAVLFSLCAAAAFLLVGKLLAFVPLAATAWGAVLLELALAALAALGLWVLG